MKVINIFNMKKIIYKSIFVLSILIFNFSCDDVERVYLNADAETILSLSADNVTLTEDTALNEILTASWTEPDFGFDAAALYTVLIDYQGGDFSEAQIVPAGSNLDMSFTVEELNAKMLSLGLTPNEATSVSFMVRVTLSEYQEMYSNTVSLSVTPYSSLLDLSTNLGVVGSATPGGWGNPDVPDLPFYATTTPNVYVAYVTLGNGEIKFSKTS